MNWIILLQNIWHVIYVFSYFIPIIFLHELGHFIAAKLCHCGVDVVSIGFGKPIYRKEIGRVIFQISPWLLGGYCKLKNELCNSNERDSFTNLSYTKKVIITTAGVIINIITGYITFFIGNRILNIPLIFFGCASISAGMVNLLPIPALDGSYLVLVWLEKFYGKEKGYSLMEKICRIGFIVVMGLNIISLPYAIYLIIHGYLI